MHQKNLKRKFEKKNQLKAPSSTSFMLIVHELQTTKSNFVSLTALNSRFFPPFDKLTCLCTFMTINKLKHSVQCMYLTIVTFKVSLVLLSLKIISIIFTTDLTKENQQYCFILVQVLFSLSLTFKTLNSVLAGHMSHRHVWSYLLQCCLQGVDYHAL